MTWTKCADKLPKEGILVDILKFIIGVNQEGIEQCFELELLGFRRGHDWTDPEGTCLPIDIENDSWRLAIEH